MGENKCYTICVHESLFLNSCELTIIFNIIYMYKAIPTFEMLEHILQRQHLNNGVKVECD